MLRLIKRAVCGAIGHGNHDAVSALAKRRWFAAGMQARAVAGKFVHQPTDHKPGATNEKTRAAACASVTRDVFAWRLRAAFNSLVVSIAQDSVATEKQRRFGSERVQNAPHFDSNVSGADDGDALWLRPVARAWDS